MSSSDLTDLKQCLHEFAQDRDWLQLHSPKNLSMALSGQVAEVMEHYQWLTEKKSRNLPQDKLSEVSTELADTLIYLIRRADELGIDLIKAAKRKIEVKEKKYPVEKAKGSAKKYTELDDVGKQKARPDAVFFL